MAIREKAMAEYPGAVRPNEDSPVRFEIIQEKLKRGDDTKEFKVIPVLMSLMLGVNKSVKSIKNNPENPGCAFFGDEKISLGSYFEEPGIF